MQIMNQYILLNIVLLIAFHTLVQSKQNHSITSEFDSFQQELSVITKYSFSRQLAIYFLQLASYGYCSVSQMLENSCCSELINKGDWILVKAVKIDYDNYNMAVLRNEKHKQIVLTFPGTRRLPQLIEQIINSFSGVSLKDDPIVKVMNYFNSVSFLIFEELHDIIRDVVEKYPDYQYIFTGHSLGGAIATIIALDSVKYNKLKASENSPVLITYGQPRTGNDVFANEVMKFIPVVFRVVRQGDLITRFPLCKLSLLRLGCKNNLPQSKFDRNLTLDDTQYKSELNYYYSWHIGGLKMFSNDMYKFQDCGEEYGDNNPILQCKLIPNLDIFNHLVYFDMWVGQYCRNVK